MYPGSGRHGDTWVRQNVRFERQVHEVSIYFALKKRTEQVDQLTTAAEEGGFWRKRIKNEADHFRRPLTRPLRKNQ